MIGGIFGGIEFSLNLFHGDKLGRMVLSQNTKQYEHQGIAQYSYTLYDELGRIKEVGQKNENGPSSTHLQDIFGSMVSSYYNPNTIDDEKFNTWINSESNSTRSEITHTYYDETHPDVIASKSYHSGTYKGGKGSSHKGGKYKNSSTNNHYRKRK